MNPLLIILIVIIILSILYLYYRNNEYNKVLESFDNNTQSSLSTYFQDNIDPNTVFMHKNMYHGNNLPINISMKRWDGLWENKSLNIYAQFIENNDQLIISLSNSSFDQIYPTISDAFVNSSIGNIKCYTNTFIGIGQLQNKPRSSSFILKEIICNNYTNPDLNLTVNNFSGEFSFDNTIKLYSEGKGQVITLKFKAGSKISNDNNYAKFLSPNTNTYPTVPDSKFVYQESICEDLDPCIDKTHGLSITTYNNLSYNACGKKTSPSNNTCLGKPTCVFYSPAPDGMETCGFSSSLYDYMSIAPLSVGTQYTGNSLLLCNYIDYFKKDKCNACIICYVTNIGTVYTLNYEFFGALPSQSNLTVQKDVMNQILNNKSTGLLPYYRNAINNNTNDKDVMNALSFTNCIENSSEIKNSIQISKCRDITKQYINNYKDPKGNSLLKPCVWQINSKPTKNVVNSCPVILNTFQNYDTPVKYAEFNNDGTTNLSLYSGGLKQQLIFDKVKIVKENNDALNTYVIMTTNLKTNNGLYLIPSDNNTGFNHSNVIRLVNEPSLSGKWLIIGFTLNNLNNLDNIINNISF